MHKCMKQTTAWQVTTMAVLWTSLKHTDNKIVLTSLGERSFRVFHLGDLHWYASVDVVLNRHAGPMYIDREAGARRHVVFKRVSVPLPNGSSSKNLAGPTPSTRKCMLETFTMEEV